MKEDARKSGYIAVRAVNVPFTPNPHLNTVLRLVPSLQYVFAYKSVMTLYPNLLSKAVSVRLS